MLKPYNAKVLVIDDEQNYLDLIADTLKVKNYKILQALNGKMGCLVAQKFMPDIIITDWEMPELNGIETIKQLKNNLLTQDIPVIMCTGIMTSSENLDSALNAGAVDFIRKPIEPLELLARINSALNLSESIKKIKLQNENIIRSQQILQEQTEEITTQRDLLEKQNTDITDSIVYASLIQQALLPNEELLENTHFQHFILYKPRDIVSGDFYWYKQMGRFIYIAAADCTGHGIPGAFMMTLGISVLEEVFNRNEILPPEVILDELRDKIKKILRQNKTEDGMDIALCLLDIESKKLQFLRGQLPIVPCTR
jgi:phosphoserine phosphatase RsbU/P